MFVSYHLAEQNLCKPSQLIRFIVDNSLKNEHKLTELQIYKLTNLQSCEVSNIQTYKILDLQIYKKREL